MLVHSTPFSSQVWRRIAPWLTDQRTVYWFDLLGYWQSVMTTDGDVSLGVQNSLMAALVQEWGLEVPVVLAHDFGGATALRTHFLDIVRYLALTLVDPVAVSPWGSPFVAHVHEHESAFAGLPGYAHDALLRAYLQGAAFARLSEAALALYMEAWQGEGGQVGFYRQIAALDGRDRIAQHVDGLFCDAAVGLRV